MFKNLTPEGVAEYQSTMLAALREYQQQPQIIPPRIVTTTEYCTHLFMASTGSKVGMKAITGSKEGFKGITTILDKHTGYPLGIVNGATLTAFRTALCNTLPLVKFYPVDNNYSNDETLAIFGVGDQAIWHTILSLILYPNRFNKVIIINRTIAKAEKLADSFKSEYPNTEFIPISTIEDGGELKLLELFKKVTVAFTCIPTSVPTITQALVDQCEKSLFIGAIGSYKPHMTEIEGQVLKNAISNGSKIVVDSKEHCLHEAGELIINGIEENELIEITDLYNEDCEQFQKSKVVVSKLVGLCLMDVWIGSKCLEQAKETGVGVNIDNF